MILDGLLAIFYWLLLLPVIYLLGSYAKRWIDEKSVLLHGIYIMGFGFATMSYFMTVLGTFGLLKASVVFPGIIALAFIRIKNFREFRIWVLEVGRCLLPPPGGRLNTVSHILLLGSLIITAALCSLPEIAHDSLCYHINLPKLFVQSGSVLPISYDLKSCQSQFLEVLFSIGIFLNNIPAAKLFHWFCGFFALLFVIRFVEVESGNRGLALTMGLAFWLTPTILNQVTVTYNDAGVTWFVLLSWGMFVSALRNGYRTRDFFLSGLFLGFATSCKYLALMFGVPMGLYLVWGVITQPDRRLALMKGIVFFSFGAFLACGYWFLRNYLFSGHPLYPVFSAKQDVAGLYAEQNYASIGVPKTLLSFLTLPITMVISPQSFEKHFWAGPYYLIILPLALFGAFRDKLARFAFFTVLISAILWFLIAQSIRFLLPIFPIFMIGAAIGFRELPVKSWASRMQMVFRVLVAVAISILIAAALYHYRIHFLALVAGWSKDTFLTRLERTYPVAKWVNENLSKDAKLFSASEIRQFYFNRPMIDAVSYYRVERYSDTLTPSEMVDRLKKNNITHVLQVLPAGEGDGKQPRGSSPLDVVHAVVSDADLAVSTKEIPSQNIRESQFVYRIYELK
ncbi:MAG TPA: hypothetical protein PK590_05550 [Candidatus Omnitrophota bacterium]|nr:hypothetical protein [Candidatus Omnitrophota bacterium]